VDLYFSNHFDVDPALLKKYGALDISVVSDLPLFVDPFLLFNSENATYQELHEEILRYLHFLRDEAGGNDLDPAMIDDLYCFEEVKQNWFGFTLLGNGGRGLGTDFAHALHEALGSIVANFGNETITAGSHLEKLCLIKPGVGKDSISDFTTNLIKGYLCDYTETFAREHVADDRCEEFNVDRAYFNYETKTWAAKAFWLPRLEDDYVLLTPMDILRREDTWINHADMVARFAVLPDTIPNEQLRARVNRYFGEKLGENPNAKQKREAAAETIRRFPELIDRYIKLKEDDGDQAESISSEEVEDTKQVLIEQVQAAIKDLQERTDFYDKPWSSYDECLHRVKYFKGYIEDNDGYKVLNRKGQPFLSEIEVHLVFGLVWCSTEFDINREPNNGRGPVDFKASYGTGDQSLIEFKLGSNRQLKRNLQNQIEIYQAANRTRYAVKAIVYYTAQDEARVLRILKGLGIEGEDSIVLIDARSDNKPSASTA
jgi:hypothetical protein